ncbi:MAG: hypothetical protein E7G24_16125 [Clostridium celatum]|nr:hypothetical protein [Clostridium celatum]
MCLNHRVSYDENDKKETLESYGINYLDYLSLTNEVLTLVWITLKKLINFLFKNIS